MEQRHVGEEQALTEFPSPRGPPPLLDHVSQASLFSKAQILFVGLLQTVYADVRQMWGRID